VDKNIKELMNENVLKEASSKFGIKFHDLKFIGGFQNFIYEYKINDKYYILRITHSSHRTENTVLGEIEFVNYLYKNGLSVSKPVFSVNKKLIEIIILEDYYFIITSFEKALGKKLKYPEAMNNDCLSELCGEITGLMHKLSSEYNPLNEIIKRHTWKDNYYIKNFEKYIPKDQKKVYDSFRILIEEIEKLKIENYGLIHGDINIGNFLIDENKITLFDFDECQYSWFVEDIAIQLFYIIYVVLDDSIPERNEQSEKFLNFFLKGYKKYFKINDYEIEKIPLFLKLREIIVYVGLHRSMDFNNMHDFFKSYIKQSRNRIENRAAIFEGVKNI